MVNTVINAAAIAAVSVFSGAWIYQWRNAIFPPTTTNSNSSGLYNLTDNFVIESNLQTNNSYSILRNLDSQAGHKTWNEYEYVIYPRLELQPTSERATIVDPQRLLPRDDLSNIRKGKWFIFFYANWCPHSRVYIKIWQELTRNIASNPAVHHPKLASASLAENPELAALLKLEKLPAFVLVMDGFIRGQAITSPTLEQLYDLVNSNWFELPKPKRIQDKPSEVMVFSMKLFDLMGKFCFTLQDTLLSWMQVHKYVVSSGLVLILIAGYLLRKSRFLKYL